MYVKKVKKIVFQITEISDFQVFNSDEFKLKHVNELSTFQNCFRNITCMTKTKR